MPEFSNKFPYIPPVEKRYAISRDSVTQERIEFIRDLQRRLIEYFGVEIVITLFGSITKGKDLLNKDIAAATDIDCTIFFDGDDVSKNFNKLFEKFTEISEYYSYDIRDSQERREIREQMAFRSFLIKHIPEIIKNDGKIPPEFVSLEIERLSVSHLQDIEFHLLDLKRDNFLDFGGLPKIMRLFQLDVGGIAPKYRTIFLKALAKKDRQTQEEVWGLISRKIRSNERYKDELEIKNLPETFVEAYKKYAKESE